MYTNPLYKTARSPQTAPGNGLGSQTGPAWPRSRAHRLGEPARAESRPNQEGGMR